MENLCMCFTLCYSLFRLWFSLDPEITGLVEEFSSAAKISSFSIVLRFDLFGFGFCFDWACSNLLVNHGPLLAGQIPDRWCRSKLADVVVDRHLQLWVFRLCRCPFLLLWTAPVECPVLPFNFSVPIRFQPSSRRPGLSSPTRPDFPAHEQHVGQRLIFIHDFRPHAKAFLILPVRAAWISFVCRPGFWFLSLASVAVSRSISRLAAPDPTLLHADSGVAASIWNSCGAKNSEVVDFENLKKFGEIH
jgi:hypothetical protein